MDHKTDSENSTCSSVKAEKIEEVITTNLEQIKIHNSHLKRSQNRYTEKTTTTTSRLKRRVIILQSHNMAQCRRLRPLHNDNSQQNILAAVTRKSEFMNFPVDKRFYWVEQIFRSIMMRDVALNIYIFFFKRIQC